MHMDRRTFLKASAGILAAAPFVPGRAAETMGGHKMRLAVVGTGVRGIGMWCQPIIKQYSDRVEYVGLCDINPGRVEFARQHLGLACPVFTDYGKMLREARPDTVVVTTVDRFHHEHIIGALESGVDVITEKPMTTDEKKCQAILDAEKRTGRKVTVTFNYRYGSHPTRIKELLREKVVGDITSVDFHWYLNCYHGADYFRRWHRLRKNGTLLTHKATHHFDLVNWWLDSEPEEVFAYGALEFYGRNHEFRHTNCRGCPHKEKCKFFWDITKDKYLMNLYAANEHYDGYLRDGCVWKEDIDIYDKMAVQVKYAGGIQMSYSLTTYSPYEGWRVAFNGTNGRLEAWQDVPWDLGFDTTISQAEHHAKEFDQKRTTKKADFDAIVVMKNFQKHELIKVPKAGGGHGGGDPKLHADIFGTEKVNDPLGHLAGTRDGAMSVLTGIAARNSIETGKPIRVADLTALKPARKFLEKGSA